MESNFSPRWNTYFMVEGSNFRQFWHDYLNPDSKVLFILGLGFDPRNCLGLQTIIDEKSECSYKCIVIRYDEGKSSPSEDYLNLVRDNEMNLREILKHKGTIEFENIQMWSDNSSSRRRIGSLNATKIFDSVSEIVEYSDVIIDISALPRSIYLSLISKLLFLIDEPSSAHVSRPNLHVIACENLSIDTQIKEIGIDETANYIYGFSEVEMESTIQIPTIWIPVLGEGKETQLERIYTLVAPDEICPAIPLLSSNPRRGDNIVIEYQELLFNQWGVEPTNIIYVSEQNPFQVYREICRTATHYYKALAPLGGCKAVISVLSNKLLSIGALLATFDLKYSSDIDVGLANVEALGYQMEYYDPKSIIEQSNLYSLWLAGDCYED